MVIENTDINRKTRVAHCLKCSNEWKSRTGDQKKPARCPECKSYNVVWKDELEKNPENFNSVEQAYSETENIESAFFDANEVENSNSVEQVISEPENTGNTSFTEETTIEQPMEKPENKVFHAEKSRKKENKVKCQRNAAKVDSSYDEAVETIRKDLEENSPRFPLIFIVLGIGVVGVVYFCFLRGKIHPPQAPPVPQKKPVLKRPTQLYGGIV